MAQISNPGYVLVLYNLTPVESAEPGVDAIERVQTPAISFASNELRDESEAGVTLVPFDRGFQTPGCLEGHPSVA
jgi:hypothetical protein